MRCMLMHLLLGIKYFSLEFHSFGLFDDLNVYCYFGYFLELDLHKISLNQFIIFFTLDIFHLPVEKNTFKK